MRVSRAVFPGTRVRGEALGARLRLARLRRRMSLIDLAARTGVSRVTLRRLEKGDLSVGLAVLARVLTVLGLDEDLDKIARDDELGTRLQDSLLRTPRRSAARRTK